MPPLFVFDLFSHFAWRASEARGKPANEVRVVVKSALAADLRDGERAMLEKLFCIIEAQAVEILLEALAHLFLEARGKVIRGVSRNRGDRRGNANGGRFNRGDRTPREGGRK